MPFNTYVSGMATRYRFGDSTIPHFITFSVINCIDVFSRECYKEIVVESLKYCIERKGLILHASIIMTHHVHLIASAREAFELSAIIRDMKKYTSRTVIAEIENNPQESRKSWMIWMFKRAGAKNSNNWVYQ